MVYSFALGHVNWPGFIFQHAGIPCSPARRCDWHQCPFLGIGNHCILYFEAKKQGRLQVVKSYSHENFFVYYCLDLSMDGSSLAVATILLIGGLVLFGIRMQFGTLLIFYVTLVTATICFTLISFVVANISKNEGQASIYSNIFAMPMLFLSSAFYSLDTAPTWIKTLSRLNPFSHFVSGLHSTIVFDLRGAAANLFILLAFGVLALIAAILTFRWDSD